MCLGSKSRAYTLRDESYTELQAALWTREIPGTDRRRRATRRGRLGYGPAREVDAVAHIYLTFTHVTRISHGGSWIYAPPPMNMQQTALGACIGTGV